MSLRHSRIAIAAVVSASVLAGLAVAGSTEATTPADTISETSVATTADAVAEASVATAPETAAVEVLPPDEPWGGLTRDEWQARRWQWNLSLPEDVNPQNDSTGQACGYGQSGPVFFLPGSGPCVVPEGTAIYVVVASTTCSTVEPPPFFGRNEEELRACTTAEIDGVTNLHAVVDGREIRDLESYRVASPLFTVVLTVQGRRRISVADVDATPSSRLERRT